MATALVFATGCDSNGGMNGDDDDPPFSVEAYDTTAVDGGPDVITVSDVNEGGIGYFDAEGNEVSDITWTSNYVYQLDNFVFVNDGQTLTIEPGTVVQGLPGSGGDAAALIVTRGGTIQADGEQDDGTINPIIFTAEGDNGDGLGRDVKGRWGGVILLGDAPINSDPPTTQIEGIPDEVGGARIRYGAENGDFDPNHDVGTFRYVSIRHTGTSLAGGDEIQGLTIGGVGNGSTVEYVESYASDDDGFEWFGGTVNTKYLISAYASDDSYDIDEGFQGGNQFWLAVHGANEAGRIGEHDGGTSPETAQPYATSDVSNATYIGIGPDVTRENLSGDGEDPFLLQRDNNATSYYNTVFMGGRTNAGLQIEDLDGSEDAANRWDDGDLQHQNNLWFNIGPAFADTTEFEDLIQLTTTENDDGVDVVSGDRGEAMRGNLADYLRTNGNQVLNTDQRPIASITRAQGERGSDGPVQSFDPAAAGPATSGASQPPQFGSGGENGSWTQVSFRGAFGPGAEWNLSEWALIAQDGTIQ
ncbi:hypothetical protein [Salinibacter sp.]|uniref:hypothetical protein n=1 Tax=Salinibacter sp. TaxID=2065818 RepID=UPI0021E7109A|nr:hypothetical protein [Salinibacter sp.]